jgi:hypothetical protein
MFNLLRQMFGQSRLPAVTYESQPSPLLVQSLAEVDHAGGSLARAIHDLEIALEGAEIHMKARDD